MKLMRPQGNQYLQIIIYEATKKDRKMFSLIRSIIGGILSIFELFRLFNPNLLKSGKIKGIFTETKPFEAGFSQHYDKYLKDKVMTFEKERILALKKSRRNFFISLPLMLLFPFVLVNINWFNLFGDNTLHFLIFIVLAFYGGIFLFITMSMTLYQDSIKTDIFPNILNFFGSFSYHPETTKSAGAYSYSELIPKFSRETSEDHITGSYKGVQIDLFETELEQVRRTKKNTYYVTVFDGIIITLSMNKEFKGKTIVRKDGGLLGNWFKNTFSSLENVKLEDPNFEKIFEVFSDDQIEARYLLTVTFMERLNELASVFGGKNIQCCFFKNELLFVLPLKKNMFEPGSIYEPEDFVDDSKSLLEELNLIFSIVDTLKLNTKLNL